MTTERTSKTESDLDSDQAMQINENTIADPGAPAPETEEAQGRDDVEMKDQAMQINDNTTADQ